MPRLGAIKKGREIGYGKGSQAYTKHIWLACIHCGRERWVGLGKTKRPEYTGLCPACYISKSNKDNKYGWRGGRNKHNGYILVWVHKNDFFYPMADRYGYVGEHRLVIAKSLGRNLQSWEIIHHRNGDREDNRIENLQLVMIDQHSQITKIEGRVKQLEDRITLLEAENTLLREQLNPRAQRIVE